jgi:hypothetical protein
MSLPRPERSWSGKQAQAISKMLPLGIADMSHRRARLSADPVSTSAPSGLKATETARLWDAATGQEILAFAGHRSDVTWGILRRQSD